MNNKCSLWKRFEVVVLFVLATNGPVIGAVHIVDQVGTSFVPSAITVDPGDTVRWVWSGGGHTVTSGTSCTFDGLYFDEPLNSLNPTFEFIVPDGVSSVPYYCRPHCVLFGMTGLITVNLPPADFVITLDGDQEVGPVDTPAAGSGTATFNPGTNLFSWEISFAALAGTETASHFHGPAVACTNGGVQITLPLGSPKVGSQVLTPQQATDVRAGRWYVNVHSDAHPGGEIRGQVMPVALVDPIPGSIPTGDIRVHLQPLATGLTAPNWGTFSPGDADRLFVADQDGILWAIDLTTGSKTVFLDVSSRLVPLGIFGADTFDERGLLGIAFDADYTTNGLLYTFTSEPVSGTADFSTMPPATTPNCHSVIAEWHVPDPANPGSVVDPGSRRELVRIDKPQFNHNGGGLEIGPDGMLYISLGDGGGADDRDGQPFISGDIIGHGCGGNGADNASILGSILRIDPAGSDSANGQYGIPIDNPFVGVVGLDEIFAYGFRNPWRISFDAFTGDLLAADVGQNDVEEIDVVVSGGNYGWRHKEGSFFFVFNGNEAGYVTDVPLDVPADLIDPAAEYDHDEGTAIVGGFVYRGSNVPELAGRYVFGDFARTFSNDGRLFYLDASSQIREFQMTGQPVLGLSLLGFGRDADGEVYVLANGTGTPFGSTGVVLRIAPGCGDLNCDGLVNEDDVAPFVLALTDPAEYLGQFSGCTEAQADCNGDGTANGADVQAFLNALIGA